uniref:Ddb1 and cul4 associated factor 5 n=1 Tax=Oryzias melastigma TaxID=30732 RepID=A0A3B3DZZ4_ORYME
MKGCGMRCSVGFLSRRELTGQPLLKEEFQRRRLAGCTSLYKKDMLGHFGCVNAIEFSNSGGEWLVSGGDDRRVLLWHMEKAIHGLAKPVKLKGEHLSNIFCLAFDSSNTKVFSGGNDEQVILHDVERRETLNVFLHIDAVYSLSVSPVNDNVFASSSDDGRVLIWDTREPPHGEPFCLASYPSAFHSVMFNPVEPRLLATANSKEGVGLWDIRKPSLLRYGGSMSLQSAMSVRFNSSGTQLLALRRRLPPVLYELHSRLPSFQFDNQGYFNSCTMKSCCFAGDRDQYILSGSDDFNLYMWKIPKDPEAGGPGRVVNGAFMVLKGHRSIVNQVRFNPHTYMICSSGVEKVIKVGPELPLPAFEQAGEEGEERPRRRSRHPSGLLEDSDSSEFWLDPMPRPRSPSPRDNSVLSSPASSPSLPAGASSPSTSTSSSSSDDEERRSAVRRRNVMRRRRMNVVSRAGDRPESVQALFSALDSCSYPSISVEDPSSSSADEDKRSAQATPHSRPAKDEDSCLSPSDFVCHSPEMSQEGGGCGAEAGEPGGSARPHRTGSDSKEACGASLSPEVNGQHRPASPTGGGVSSDAEEEEGLSPGDGRPQSEKGAAKKRTHLGAHPSGSSPTEKKLRT